MSQSDEYDEGEGYRSGQDSDVLVDESRTADFGSEHFTRTRDPRAALFGAALAALAEQRVRELEAAEVQRMADDQKTAEMELSRDRAGAFVEIMREYQIPTKKILGQKFTFAQYYELIDSKDVPHFNEERFDLGQGWTIGDDRGMVVLEDATAYEFKVSDTRPGLGDVIAFSHDAKDDSYVVTPLESPFAENDGLAILGDALIVLDIVSDENINES